MPQLKAIIEYGKVTNIIVHEGGELTLPEGQMYINVGDQGVKIGWTYDYVTGLFYNDEGLTMAHRVSIAESALNIMQTVSGILFTLEAESEEPRFDETTMAEHAELFKVWDENWMGKRGQIVRDEGGLYKAIHDVIVSAQNRKPSSDTANQLWKQIGNPGDEWPMWSQPINGVDNPYMLGDKVSRNEKRWVSNIDNNWWEPGAYGWDEVWPS